MSLVGYLDNAVHERVICAVVVEYPEGRETMPKGTAASEVAGIVWCSVYGGERYGVNSVILVGPDDRRSLFHRHDRRVIRIRTDGDDLCRTVDRYPACLDSLARNDAHEAGDQEQDYLAHSSMC